MASTGTEKETETTVLVSNSPQTDFIDGDFIVLDDYQCSSSNPSPSPFVDCESVEAMEDDNPEKGGQSKQYDVVIDKAEDKDPEPLLEDILEDILSDDRIYDNCDVSLSLSVEDAERFFEEEFKDDTKLVISRHSESQFSSCSLSSSESLPSERSFNLRTYFSGRACTAGNDLHEMAPLQERCEERPSKRLKLETEVEDSDNSPVQSDTPLTLTVVGERQQQSKGLIMTEGAAREAADTCSVTLASKPDPRNLSTCSKSSLIADRPQPVDKLPHLKPDSELSKLSCAIRPQPTVNDEHWNFNNYELDDEIQDIEDPEWQYMQELNTDVDRYRAVRNRWKNMSIPNQNHNLTYQNYRLFRLRGLSDVEIVYDGKSRKRPLADRLGPKPAKRVRYERGGTCSDVFGFRMSNVTMAHELEKNNVQEKYKNIVHEMSAIHRREFYMLHERMSAENLSPAFRRKEEIALECRQRQEYSRADDTYAKQVRNLDDRYHSDINRLTESRREILTIQSFYSGLNNPLDDHALSRKKEIELLDDLQLLDIEQSDNMYKLYNSFYNVSGNQNKKPIVPQNNQSLFDNKNNINCSSNSNNDNYNNFRDQETRNWF